MMSIVECDLAQGEVRLSVGKVAPDEHHGRARRGGEQDEPRDVGLLIWSAGSIGLNSWPMNIQPSKAMENGLTPQLMNSVTPMPRQCSLHLTKRPEVDLQQHRNDHQPDQHGDR